MIITIDGPAGAGKSTAACFLAHTLTEYSGKTFGYLDTGSLYRAIALLGLRRHVNWDAPSQIERLVFDITLTSKKGRTLLNGEDITESVRSPEVTEKTHYVADNPSIRSFMSSCQRNIAKLVLQDGRGIVTEGRDQGTVVFPDAPVKFFLTATPEERAKRRFIELQESGIQGDVNEIFLSITKRDRQDIARTVGALREPDNAIKIVSDGISLEDVVNQMFQESMKILHNLS
ncbi:MAG: (d)CMP kinase, partial [Planctomycetaceae bacterium]|nr:(d)CMP kinase [Planctomycetaceae bacterium]